MTRPQTSADPKIPCWPTGPAAFGLPPFGADQAGAFPPGLRPGAWPRTAPRSTPSPPTRRRPASTTPSWRWRRAGATSTASPTSSSSWPAPTPARPSRRSSARSRRCSPATATRSISNRALYARIADLYRPARRRSASMPSRPACSTATTPASCAPGGALDKPAQDRLAAINERLASLGTQFGQNVLADEKAYALVLEEGDLAGLPDFARAAARAAARGARASRANTPSRWRARRARPSCSSPPAATCARRSSRPGSSAARTAGRPTTARSSPRWWPCAPSARSCSGFATFADYRLDDQMAKTPAGGAQAARRGLGPRARQGRRPSATRCRR